MVHRREIQGEEAVFGNQGALWGNAMTWWDHGTGSIWSQPLGEAIAGPLRGEALDLLPSTLTRWGSWREAHPDTLALDADGRVSGFALDRMAIVVDLGVEAAAYPVRELRERGPANDVVAGLEVAVLVDPSDEERWAVFFRRLVDGTVLTLAVEEGRLVDRETGSAWDPVRGRALEGPLAGEILDQLPGFTAFPRDYLTFWPGGRIWGEDEPSAAPDLGGWRLNLRD